MKALRHALIAVVGAGAIILTVVAAEPSQPAGTVTFAKDVAPIVFEHCAGCHRPEGAAPFSLLTYAAARSRAKLIATVTTTGLMPPWKSEPGSGGFVGHN